MITIVPFEQDHADYILSQQLNANELYLKPEHKKYAKFVENIGMSFTGLANGKPIAAGGIYILWDGVAEGWVMATSEIWQHKIYFALQFKKRTEILLKSTKIKRLQTSVKADFDLGQKFAEFLGLEKEGLMKNYGPDGADYYRYARIIK
tara:strand:- start:84 stop:530 length:447 start_codon:yes stop_codon:yes gene_type:complete